MRQDVLTIRGDASVSEAVRLLAERGSPCAVVVDEEGCPRGIITERDVLVLARVEDRAGLAAILRRMLEEEHHIFDSMRRLRQAAASSRVEEVMSTPVQCADVEMTLGQMADIMETFDDRQLPVVEEGRLVGLVTRQDIVRAIADKA